MTKKDSKMEQGISMLRQLANLVADRGAEVIGLAQTTLGDKMAEDEERGFVVLANPVGMEVLTQAQENGLDPKVGINMTLEHALDHGTAERCDQCGKVLFIRAECGVPGVALAFIDGHNACCGVPIEMTTAYHDVVHREDMTVDEKVAVVNDIYHLGEKRALEENLALN